MSLTCFTLLQQVAPLQIHPESCIDGILMLRVVTQVPYIEYACDCVSLSSSRRPTNEHKWHPRNVTGTMIKIQVASCGLQFSVCSDDNRQEQFELAQVLNTADTWRIERASQEGFVVTFCGTMLLDCVLRVGAETQTNEPYSSQLLQNRFPYYSVQTY